MTGHGRPIAALLAGLTLTVVGGMLAGCSEAADEPPTAGTGTGSELTITVDRGDGSSPQRWTLSCDPAGGDHPDPDTACETLEGGGVDAFEPVPADTACTEIYGGSQTATVTGSWRGTPVEAELSRINGCEIARWDALQPVLVEPGGVS